MQQLEWEISSKFLRDMHEGIICGGKDYIHSELDPQRSWLPVLDRIKKELNGG